MEKPIQTRKTVVWAAGGVAVLLALVLLWFGIWKPAKIREQNLQAVSQVLFTRPDPMVVLMTMLDWEDYKQVATVVGSKLDYLKQVAPYCTEQGNEYAFKINSGLDRSCADSGMESTVQSVTLGPKDEQGYYTMTIVVAYGIPGEASNNYTFTGAVGFDKQGLVDYFYISHFQTSEFTKLTRTDF